MRASNPLIAVGISAAVILGTTSAASAQAEPSADIDSGQAKENGGAEVQASPIRGNDRKQTAELELSEQGVTQAHANASQARIEIFVASATSPVANQSVATNQPGKPMSEAGSIATQPQPAQPKATQMFLTQAAEDNNAAEDDNAAESGNAVEGNGADEGNSSDQAEPLSNAETPEVTEASEADAAETAQDPEKAEATSSEPDAEPEQPIEPLAQEETPDSAQEETSDEVSPETIDETTEELEQRGEEAEETVEPDNLPPQDLQEENGLPSEVEPSDLPDAEEPTRESTEIQPSAPTDEETGAGAPEYLDTGANPLLFPTTPEEVELQGTQPLTLEQAIEAGLRNNEELQVTRLELQRLRASLREAQSEEYPDVNANAQLGYSASEQPDSTTSFDPNNPGETIFEVDGTEVSRSLTLGGSLELSYAIFTSGRRPALIESAERQMRFQELQVESDTEDLILQITNDYYNLQEADEQVQIFRATLEEAERSLRDAEALERAGVGTRFDVLQAQVDVANALQNLRNQESQQEIARRQLAERLNLNQSLTLAAADPVEVAGVWDLSLEETIVAAYRNRAELEQQLVQREIAERNRRAALAQLGPQLTFQTSYGLNNTLESDPNSPSEEVGFLSDFQAALGLSMILFDGGAARAQARQAEANIAIAESNFANQRDQIRFNVEQAYAQLQSNFENIQTTALAVQQAVEALRLARLRFQAGVGTQTDVLQAQTALTQARFNNLQAILDYNRALASLQREVSNYPEGYLNEVP